MLEALLAMEALLTIDDLFANECLVLDEYPRCDVEAPRWRSGFQSPWVDDYNFPLLFFLFFFFGGVNTYSTTNHMFKEAYVNELIMLVAEFNSKVHEDLVMRAPNGRAQFL